MTSILDTKETMSQRVSISNISTSPEVGDAVVIYVWNPFGMSNFHGVPSRESLSYSLKLRSGKARLYCYEQWLREEVRIEGTETLGLHHLYRAMDILEAEKEEIEQALYFRLADLLHLDVELIFYDTTSLHVEIDEIDRGEGHDDLVEGSMAAGSKVYKAPRKRGMSKNGRSDAPQIVIGLAVTRDGLPVRHWVFPGNTVDVTTVSQVKGDLKGWQLSRCVFVGDAGMVSQDHLKRLSESGGNYILCTRNRHPKPATP